jgi:ABC-type uncharacterized transport system ATPase subunit
MALEKAVKLNFAAPVTRGGSRLRRRHPRGRLEAEMRVPRGAVAATAQRILAELPVADIAIEDTPIEAVIGQFMAAGVAPA